MRYSTILSTLILICALCALTTGCNNGTYANPVSPPAATTEWRTFTVDYDGGTFDFSDIGAVVKFPEGAIGMGESYTFRIRLFPAGIPLLPSGPVLVRLGTFELAGSPDPDFQFELPVEVLIRIAEARDPGIGTEGWQIDSQYKWAYLQAVPLMNDGIQALMRITGPGIYGSFERVPLHIEATVSRQQGPAPLSVTFKGIVTGGYPPYQVFWDFGDNEDPRAGVTTSHMYKDPGVYDASVTVIDHDGVTVVDHLTLTAYAQGGPADL